MRSDSAAQLGCSLGIPLHLLLLFLLANNVAHAQTTPRYDSLYRMVGNKQITVHRDGTAVFQIKGIHSITLVLPEPIQFDQLTAPPVTSGRLGNWAPEIEAAPSQPYLLAAFDQILAHSTSDHTSIRLDTDKHTLLFKERPASGTLAANYGLAPALLLHGGKTIQVDLMRDAPGLRLDTIAKFLIQTGNQAVIAASHDGRAGLDIFVTDTEFFVRASNPAGGNFDTIPFHSVGDVSTYIKSAVVASKTRGIELTLVAGTLSAEEYRAMKALTALDVRSAASDWIHHPRVYILKRS